MRLRSFDTKGVAIIQFSKPLMQIANISLVEESQAFSFIIFIAGSPTQTVKVIGWKILDWGNNFIKVQLNISDSDKLSTGEVSSFEF